MFDDVDFFFFFASREGKKTEGKEGCWRRERGSVEEDDVARWGEGGKDGFVHEEGGEQEDVVVAEIRGGVCDQRDGKEESWGGRKAQREEGWNGRSETKTNKRGERRKKKEERVFCDVDQRFSLFLLSFSLSPVLRKRWKTEKGGKGKRKGRRVQIAIAAQTTAWEGGACENTHGKDRQNASLLFFVFCSLSCVCGDRWKGGRKRTLLGADLSKGRDDLGRDVGRAIGHEGKHVSNLFVFVFVFRRARGLNVWRFGDVAIWRADEGTHGEMRKDGERCVSV